MEKKEAKELLSMILVAYPNFLNDDKKAYTTKDKIAFWDNELSDMDYKGAKNRLRSYIRESPYEPKISDVASYKPAELNQDWKKSFEDGGVM